MRTLDLSHIEHDLSYIEKGEKVQFAIMDQLITEDVFVEDLEDITYAFGVVEDKADFYDNMTSLRGWCDSNGVRIEE